MFVVANSFDQTFAELLQDRLQLLVRLLVERRRGSDVHIEFAARMRHGLVEGACHSGKILHATILGEHIDQIQRQLVEVQLARQLFAQNLALLCRLLLEGKILVWCTQNKARL